jgi:hypothetical protein
VEASTGQDQPICLCEDICPGNCRLSVNGLGRIGIPEVRAKVAEEKEENLRPSE